MLFMSSPQSATVAPPADSKTVELARAGRIQPDWEPWREAIHRKGFAHRNSVADLGKMRAECCSKGFDPVRR